MAHTFNPSTLGGSARTVTQRNPVGKREVTHAMGGTTTTKNANKIQRYQEYPLLAIGIYEDWFLHQSQGHSNLKMM